MEAAFELSLTVCSRVLPTRKHGASDVCKISAVIDERNRTFYECGKNNHVRRGTFRRRMRLSGIVVYEGSRRPLLHTS